ncbi:MAG: aminoacyl-tRNA hydrolase [Patescibacteria group bacterium]|nr:aminoacyl-tRNA hydrolase [Patescibacteria group bacterium]
MVRFDPRSIKLILGIGNPGKEFHNTYHNAGLLALSHIATHYDTPAFHHVSGKSFSYSKKRPYVLAQSLVFMNESGNAAHDACSFFKIPPEHLLVLHDDSDLSTGTVADAFSRGSAGHNGVISIINTLGTENFWRIRIGIRPSTELQRKKAGDFVLSPITQSDYMLLEKAFDLIVSLLQFGAKT